MSDHDSVLDLDLGAELTIVQAAGLREQLIAHLGEHVGDLRLNLAGAHDVDSATVQLLLSLRRSLQARGDVLHLTGCSRAMAEVLALYGLQALLPVHGTAA